MKCQHVKNFKSKINSEHVYIYIYNKPPNWFVENNELSSMRLMTPPKMIGTVTSQYLIYILRNNNFFFNCEQTSVYLNEHDIKINF